ncbi:MAG: RluA family pseudouridine synthase [Alphaproteobacteria bacterium]|nr:RluA family pseudouridine synthase [Alphaproteobacteria bacterium]
MEKIEIVIGEGAVGLRLDKALADAMPTVSRVKVKELIEAGAVAIDGAAITDVRRKVVAEEVYIVALPEEKNESVVVPENIPLEILYEDDDVIVINKPAGMVVHNGAGVRGGTLVNALAFHTGGRLASQGSELGRDGIVHRLDKDTTGAMMACKTDAAFTVMAKQFESHEVRREYVALVWGVMNPIAGTCDANIDRSSRDFSKMCVVKDGGRRAITHYTTEEVFTIGRQAVASLVRFRLETGRTHQIRVHSAFVGNPVVGDMVYGDAGRRLRTIEVREAAALLAPIARQMLHSENIEFHHPVSGRRIKKRAEMPKDFAVLLRRVRKLSN